LIAVSADRKRISGTAAKTGIFEKNNERKKEADRMVSGLPLFSYWLPGHDSNM
jgi:hypothetical protein